MAIGREKGDCSDSDNEVALDRSNTLLYHFFFSNFLSLFSCSTSFVMCPILQRLAC